MVVALGGLFLFLRSKPSGLVGPPTTEAQHRLANRLPANFQAWVPGASFRQLEVVRSITAYQLLALGYGMPDDLQPIIDTGANTTTFRAAMLSAQGDTTLGVDDYRTGDPQANAAGFWLVNGMYLEQFNLPPGPPA